VKSYNKTKPMKIEEFEAEKEWWGNEINGFGARKESEYAWKLSIADIKARNYNLDIKNPHISHHETQDPEALLAQYNLLQEDIAILRAQLQLILGEALQRGNN